MEETSGVLLKAGASILTRESKTFWNITANKIVGVQILIVGPSDSGKTCMAYFLEYGEIVPLSDHETTNEPTNSDSSYQISIGRNQALKLRVRRTKEIPGQQGAKSHAWWVKQERPHIILLVMDASQPVAILQEWLSEFCERLEDILLNDLRLKKKIRGIFVSLNKKDRVHSNHLLARKKAVKRTLHAGLKTVFGASKARHIPVVPTVSVTLADGRTDLEGIRELLRKMALAMKRK